MVHAPSAQFLTDIDWGQLDYLVIDLPPGTGDAQLTLTQTAPLSGAVIVTTPQDVSLIDARKGLEMFRQVRVPVLGIVENMSYFIGDDGKRYDIFRHGGGRKLAAGGRRAVPGRDPDRPARGRVRRRGRADRRTIPRFAGGQGVPGPGGECGSAVARRRSRRGICRKCSCDKLGRTSQRRTSAEECQACVASAEAGALKATRLVR